MRKIDGKSRLERDKLRANVAELWLNGKKERRKEGSKEMIEVLD